MYAKVAWARVVKYVEVSAYLVEALLKGFDQTWGARNALFQ
jgi:hypothetical protein